MGEYAELSLTQEIENMDEIKVLKELFKDSSTIIWKDKTGKKWKLKDMATSHIKNSRNKCVRDEWREHFIPLFEDELKRRKEK